MFATYMRSVVPYGARDMSIAARNRGPPRAIERRKRVRRAQLRAPDGTRMHELPPQLARAHERGPSIQTGRIHASQRGEGRAPAVAARRRRAAADTACGNAARLAYQHP